MRAVILDGSLEQDKTGERVRAALTARLHQSGAEVEHFPLHSIKIGNCAGDFYCWVRNPGVCNIDDDNRKIAGAIARSDLLVYLTPVTFGYIWWILIGIEKGSRPSNSKYFAILCASKG
jgi:multimeric flavodoxin WrbA